MSDSQDGGPERRLSDGEREAAVTRLQSAFSGGFLDVEELDARLGGAYKARTRFDLVPLVADLPAEAPAITHRLVPASQGPDLERRKGIAVHRSKIEQRGRWLVPERFKVSAYKGVLLLDLRQAVLSGAITVLQLSCYKSRIEIVVPPGFRAELRGSSYKAAWTTQLPSARADGPLLELRGSNYKGEIIVREEPAS